MSTENDRVKAIAESDLKAKAIAAGYAPKPVPAFVTPDPAPFAGPAFVPQPGPDSFVLEPPVKPEPKTPDELDADLATHVEALPSFDDVEALAEKVKAAVDAHALVAAERLKNHKQGDEHAHFGRKTDQHLRLALSHIYLVRDSLVKARGTMDEARARFGMAEGTRLANVETARLAHGNRSVAWDEHTGPTGQ